MDKIKLTDLTPVNICIDDVAQVFSYNKRILRVINRDYIEDVKHMFECGFIDTITKEKLFPKTWISDIEIEDCILVIEHETIMHWNYPYEWSFDMLKDAGMLILKVNTIANKYGYQIKDGHAFNVVFNMNQPQYIDLGSFVKLNQNDNEPWFSYRIFYNHFYIPLYLWSKGYSDIARNIFLMRDLFNEEEFYKIKYSFLNTISAGYFVKMIIKLKDLVPTLSQKKLEHNINSLNIPFESSVLNNDNMKLKTDTRLNRILEIVNNFQDASSLVELVSNKGKFTDHGNLAESVLENSHLKKAFVAHNDLHSVNIMYINNKNNNNFLPLLLDLARTSGRRDDEYINKRIKSDILIALDVTHHLIFAKLIPIKDILNTLSKFTSKYIIVQFIPYGYAADINNIPEKFRQFNVEWFKSNFLQYFDLILDEKVELNTHLFVGKIKRI